MPPTQARLQRPTDQSASSSMPWKWNNSNFKCTHYTMAKWAIGFDVVLWTQIIISIDFFAIRLESFCCTFQIISILSTSYTFVFSHQICWLDKYQRKPHSLKSIDEKKTTQHAIEWNPFTWEIIFFFLSSKIKFTIFALWTIFKIITFQNVRTVHNELMNEKRVEFIKFNVLFSCPVRILICIDAWSISHLQTK